MLIDEPAVLHPDRIGLIIGGGKEPERCVEHLGIYFIGHFGNSRFLAEQGFCQYSQKLSDNPYGVCDDVEQLLEHYPELEGDPNRFFVVTMTKIVRAQQSPYGGWRWHKWGPYIGDHKPTCEYLYDEEGIDFVYVYHIYEKLPEGAPLDPYDDIKAWDKYWETVEEVE